MTLTRKQLHALVKQYVDLLILQYRAKPRARETVALMVRQMLADGIAFDLQDAFDLDTATGAQLDTIGEIVGISRAYKMIAATGEYFGFVDYDPTAPQNTNGYRDYNDPSINPNTPWRQYTTQPVTFTLMDDPTYRVAIKLKIVRNNSDSTTKSITETLHALFGRTILFVNNKDMTITYIIDDTIITIPPAVLATLLPCPMGVGMNIITVDKVFSFSRYETVLPAIGFRRYAGPPTAAKFLRYADQPK